MENRFAGAHDQGERRRRRLSREDAEFHIAEESALPPCAADQSVECPVDDSILRRVVSPEIWKSALIIFATSLVSAGLIWWAPQPTNFSVDSADATRSSRFAGLLLIAAGQFAILTGWVRSLSPVDFKGRYRCWKWMGLGSCSSGFVLVLGLSGQLPGLLSAILEPFAGQIRAAQPAIMFIAGATVSVVVLARVLPDMSRCFLSQGLLYASVLLTIVKLMLQHSAHVAVSAATFDALTLSSANGVFASMLVHCRYVTYVCNAPPVVPGPETKVSGHAEKNPATEVAPSPPASDEKPSELRKARSRKSKSKSSKRRAA